MDATARLDPCPDCGVGVPVHPIHPSWCASCGWGLQRPPSRGAERAGRWARLAARAARRLDEESVARQVAVEDLRPRLGAARAAATVVAVGVLLVWLALGAGAVLLLARGAGNPFAYVLALVLGLLFAAMRPRVGKVPRDGVLTVEHAPALHALVADVAALLGAQTVDVIVMDTSFNAAWGVYGLRRRRVLWLGLPLLVTLDDEELVALIAHELGHEVNGDALRNRTVGAAMSALEALVGALTPHPDEGRYAFGGLAEVTTALMHVLLAPFVALRWTMFLLLMRESQRAEYLADHLAARVAGTEAEIRTDERLLLGPYLDSIVQRRALDGSDDGQGLLAELRAAARAVPPHELERRRRIADLEDVDLLATHPPTGRRIAVLRRRPPLAPALVLDDARRAALAAELAAFARAGDREIVDHWRAGHQLA
jgi:heat shock protein HtpX